MNRTKQFNRLLSLDAPDFLAEAYPFMLGRAIDPEGFRNYYEQLRVGNTRLGILAEIHASTEGQANSANVPAFVGLVMQATAFVAKGDAGRAAVNIKELLYADDAAFVDCAFRTLLRRPPDPVGFARHVELIRGGASKMRVVCALAFSKEGRGNAFAVPGVSGALVRYLVARTWLIGAVYRAVSPVEAETTLECRVRRAENLITRIARERQRESLEFDAAAADVDRILSSLSDRLPA